MTGKCSPSDGRVPLTPAEGSVREGGGSLGGSLRNSPTRAISRLTLPADRVQGHGGLTRVWRSLARPCPPAHQGQEFTFAGFVAQLLASGTQCRGGAVTTWSLPACQGLCQGLHRPCSQSSQHLAEKGLFCHLLGVETKPLQSHKWPLQVRMRQS